MRMLDPQEYPLRRKELEQRLGAHSALLLVSGSEKTRNADTHYKFRVDSDFYYVTGFAEPEAIFLLRPSLEKSSTLFCQDHDPAMEQWEGKRLGPERAPEVLKISQAFSNKEMDQRMIDLLDGVDTLFYPIGRYEWLDRAVGKWQRNLKAQARKGKCAPLHWSDVDRVLHSMRCIKSKAELEQMSAVADITSLAHRAAMSLAQPGIWEYQLEAAIVSEFMMHGCQAAAYSTIVAGGENANILHYVSNNQQIKDGDLVLIDAGGELDGYAADVTRTFPVNGKFNSAQKEVYNIVLESQLAAIKVLKPGMPYDIYHNTALNILVDGLISLGLLKGTREDNIESGSYKRFYMHRTGHYLGMDVHDVGTYMSGKDWITLKSGMVVTVEPGLYIPNEDDIPAAFRGIGIRIEDDIVLTDSGTDNLTHKAPKTVADIEAWMSQ